MSEQGIIDIIRQAYIDGWANTPIPALSLSAGGLVALADLHTVAKRTVIKGGSSWLDALVLAPGLHYQQAADALDRDSAAGLSAELGLTAAVETTADGKTVQHHKINNVALTNFLKRVAINGPKDETVTLNVGAMKQREEVDVLIRKFNAIASRRSRKTMATTQQGEDDCVPDETDREDADILSHLLYLASPLLTVSSSTLMAVLGDWWGVGFIVALMASRLINIWIIKQRVKTGIDIPTIPEPTLDPITPQLAAVPSGSSSTVAAASVGEDKTSTEQKEEVAEPMPETNPATEYTIELGGKRKVVLRGLTNDLQALTSPTFLRNKTDMDGYLEAVAKLIVYMVASFSGNLSQSGAIVLMALLLSSAGLLGLSNAHVRDLQMNGRVARPDMPLRGDADEESGCRTGIPVENLRGRRVKTT